MHQKSAQQFVRFVELLTSSENYAELGRRLLVEGVAVGEEGGWEGDPEKYGEWLEVDEGGKKKKKRCLLLQ